MVRRVDLRDSDHQHRAAEREFALRDFANVPGLLRSDHHSFSVEVHVSAAAPIWQRWHAVFVWRHWRSLLADAEQNCVAPKRDERAWSACHLCRGPDCFWRADACPWTTWRPSGAELPGAVTACSLHHCPRSAIAEPGTGRQRIA